MGLLDQVIGGLVSGGGSAGGSPLQNVLMNMLGGGQQGGAAAQSTQGQGFNNPGTTGAGAGLGGLAGGLGGLVAAFQQAGLGQVVQSWISNGPNQQVSPQQLQNVFGQDQVQAMAGQAGMQPHDFLSQLSQHLPNVVNGVTPNGHLPDEGSVSV